MHDQPVLLGQPELTEKSLVEWTVPHARRFAPVGQPRTKSMHRYRLTPSDLLAGAEQAIANTGQSGSPAVWDVQTTEDAAALLAGCPLDMVIACSFHRAYAPNVLAQQEAIRRLAEAQPAGMAFATVDLAASPAVAEWAGVRSAEVRLLQKDGSVLAVLTPEEVKAGALHKLALDKAKGLAKLAEQKLASLSERFPKALQTELGICLPRDSPEKMKQSAAEIAGKIYGAESQEVEMVAVLCQSCEKAVVPRPRLVAGLAKIIRATDAKSGVPFLDLARRLAGQRLCGGAEPGAQEALELLLDSSLCKVDSESPGPCLMLALQLLANSFHQPAIAEALLPVVAQVVQASCMNSQWFFVCTSRSILQNDRNRTKQSQRHRPGPGLGDAVVRSGRQPTSHRQSSGSGRHRTPKCLGCVERGTAASDACPATGALHHGFEALPNR